MSASSTQHEALKIILDSNALFVPIEFKIDIFEEVERLLNRRVDLVLLSPVKRELELLATKDSPKIRRQASFALKFAEKCKYIPIGEDEKNKLTTSLLMLQKLGIRRVFTNDSLLRRRLRDIRVPVIYVRQKSRLEIDGLI